MKFEDINPLLMAIVPALARHHDRVTVEHRHYNSNNGDDTLYIDKESPATQILVKGSSEKVPTYEPISGSFIT